MAYSRLPTITYTIASSTTVPNDHNCIYMCSNSFTITITLPANPRDGQTIEVVDQSGSAANNTQITLSRNGSSYQLTDVGGSTTNTWVLNGSRGYTKWRYNAATSMFVQLIWTNNGLGTGLYQGGYKRYTEEVYISATNGGLNTAPFLGSYMFPVRNIGYITSGAQSGMVVKVLASGISDSSGITLSTDGVCLKGEANQSNTGLSYDTSLMSLRSDITQTITVSARGIYLKDLIFAPSGACLTLQSCNELVVEKCYFKTTTTNAIATSASLTSNGTTIVFKDCDFTGLTGSVAFNLVTVVSSGTATCYFIDCKFGSATVNTASSWTIYVQNCSGLTVGATNNGTWVNLGQSAQLSTSTTKTGLTSLTGVVSGGFALVTSDSTQANNGLYFLSRMPAATAGNWTQLSSSYNGSNLLVTDPTGGSADATVLDTALTNSYNATKPVAGTNISLSGTGNTTINTSSTPTFTSGTFSANTNQLVLGTTNTQTFTMASQTGSRTFTLPDANSNPIQPLGSATSNNWVQYINANGVQQLAQPAFSNISGTLTTSQLPGGGVNGISAAKATAYVQGFSSAGISNGAITITGGTLTYTNGLSTNSTTGINLTLERQFRVIVSLNVTVAALGAATFTITGTNCTVITQARSPGASITQYLNLSAIVTTTTTASPVITIVASGIADVVSIANDSTIEIIEI